MPLKRTPIPSWDELFMRHAYLIATKSKDERTQIGAVIVKDNRVISEGYNGIPQRVLDNVSARQERPEKYFWFEHAERNSVFGCARHGISSAGATIYTQGIPCADCSRAVIQAGIREVVVHSRWEKQFNVDKWKENAIRSKKMFEEAGLRVRSIDTRLGIKGYCDGRVIKV